MSSALTPLANAATTRARPLVVLVGLLVLGVSIAVIGGTMTKATNPEVSKQFYAAGITLFFASVLGGVATALFAELDRRRARRDASAAFLAAVLDDLKSVYDRTERARTLIDAHRSALTYGNEMRDLIDARVTLLNVVRALERDPRAIGLHAQVEENVRTMEHYLATVVDEFRAGYKDVSDTQKVYEGQVKAMLDAPGATTRAITLPVNAPWILLRDKAALRDLLNGAARDGKSVTRYEQEFVTPLDDASRSLRTALNGSRG